MTNFQIEGTSRQVGAIGKSEYFCEFIQAESSQEAYNLARMKQYNQNRELVHVTSVRADWKDTGEYTPVEPRAYL